MRLKGMMMLLLLAAGFTGTAAFAADGDKAKGASGGFIFGGKAKEKPAEIVTVADEEAPAAAPAAKAMPAPPATPATPAAAEVQSKLQAIQTQAEWVAKLNKQLQGETKQLSEMRTSFVESFNVDAKKLEAGAYTFDTKSGKIVEK